MKEKPWQVQPLSGQLCEYHQLTQCPQVHTILLRAQKYLLLLFLPEFFPGQIPTNARVSKTNSIAHGSWKTVLITVLFSTLCDLIEKNGTGVKWPGRGSTGRSVRVLNKSCSSRHRLLSTFSAISGDGHCKGDNNVHWTSSALPKTSSYTLWPETCHNHSAMLDLSLPLKDKHLTVGARAWRQEPAVLCG